MIASTLGLEVLPESAVSYILYFLACECFFWPPSFRPMNLFRHQSYSHEVLLASIFLTNYEIHFIFTPASS